MMSDVPVDVCWEGPLFSVSGYAAEAREFVLGLSALGVRVRAVPVRWPLDGHAMSAGLRRQILRQMDVRVERGAPHVHHGFPTRWRLRRSTRRRIGRTMFETDRIPREWVRRLNALDEIWVPSRFNVETFTGAGVRADKLVAVPSPIRMRDFASVRSPLSVGRDRQGFTFLSVFDWSWRKGWDVLLRAFCAEFDPSHDDVALLLHVHSSYGRTCRDLCRLVDRFVSHEIQKRRHRPRIRVSDGLLPAHDMPHLYAAADAFVLPTRGEGWGRPFMEAMAAGLPVIGTAWSGHLDFMHDGNSYLCGIERIVPVPAAALQEAPAFKGHAWAEPSVDDLRRLMRRVVDHPIAAQKKGLAARRDIAAVCDVEVVCRQVIERLRPSAAPDRRARTRRLGLVWEGAFFVHHSLANINREIAVLLARRGLDVGLEPFEADQFDESLHPSYRLIADRLRRTPSHVDCHVRHRWPPSFARPRRGAFILVQPWEYGWLPRAWVPPIQRHVAEVWVHTQYVRDIYRRSGIADPKIAVVPLGVNPEVFNPQVPGARLPTRKSFKFLFVGGAAMHRKGFDLLLDAYADEFSAADDVCLVVKDGYYGDAVRREIAAVRRRRNAPQIRYMYGNVNPLSLGSLYTACDCYVHPYRSEGFGLPIIEAMACGLPVIVTGWGASRDYCDERVAYLVPAEEQPLPRGALSGRYRTVAPPVWSEPDRPSLRRLMRHVFEHPDEGRRMGARASAHILARFTWARTVDAMIARMEQWR